MKRIEYFDHRIIVEVCNERVPAARHYFKMEDVRSVLRAINRHVDGIHSCSIEYNREETCEFCGSVWEETGECCQKALDEVEATAQKGVVDAQ